MTIGHDPALLVQRDYPGRPPSEVAGAKLARKTIHGHHLNGPMVLVREINRVGQGPRRNRQNAISFRLSPSKPGRPCWRDPTRVGAVGIENEQQGGPARPQVGYGAVAMPCGYGRQIVPDRNQVNLRVGIERRGAEGHRLSNRRYGQHRYDRAVPPSSPTHEPSAHVMLIHVHTSRATARRSPDQLPDLVPECAKLVGRVSVTVGDE